MTLFWGMCLLGEINGSEPFFVVECTCVYHANGCGLMQAGSGKLQLTIECLGHRILDDAGRHGLGGCIEALGCRFERVGGA